MRRKNLCWLLRTVVGPRCALVTIDATSDGSSVTNGIRAILRPRADHVDN